jgi:hypothetical protein
MYRFCDMPRRAMLDNIERRRDVPVGMGKVCHLAMRCSFWGRHRAESGIQYLTTFPKLKSLIKNEFWWPTIGRSPKQHLINAKDEKVLYEVWKKELGTDEESKLPRVTWLTSRELDRKAERERVRLHLF